MQSLALGELRNLFESEFKNYREEDWAVKWRRNYVEQVKQVRSADWTTWSDPGFQQHLWDDAAVSTIGPGQAVTLVNAYVDKDLAKRLFEVREMLGGLSLEQRSSRLQQLYDEVLGLVYPRYTPSSLSE